MNQPAPISRLSAIWPEIERAAHDSGALHVGASTLDDGHVELFERWLDRGHQAGMSYLHRNLAIRQRPLERFPWAGSAIVFLVPYSADRPVAPHGALSNHLARYALGDDYHLVIDKLLQGIEGTIARLAPGTKTWRYVDTGPLSDRSLAAQAGLGWIGRNAMLIHERDGSWFFIAILLTSLENDVRATEVADRCGTCTRCVEACPTAAILDDRTIDSHRCISYATIEHRGAFEGGIEQHLAGNAFGCDICQEVCPWNATPPEPHPSFEPRPAYTATPVTDLIRYSQAEFSALFTRSAVKRAKLDGMRRNVTALHSR